MKEEVGTADVPVEVSVTESTSVAVPDWLQPSEVSPITEVVPEATLSTPDDILVPDASLAPEPPVSSPEPSSDALPDWLVDSLKAPEATPAEVAPIVKEVKKEEKKKKPKKTEVAQKEKTPPLSPAPSGDIPDWLK